MNTISLFSNVFLNKIAPNKKANSTYLKPMPYDSVSFSGKRNLPAEIKNLPEECFPSAGLREYLLKGLDESNDTKNIAELHREYYSKLRDCTTLDEAKALYPELNRVIDAKEINLSTVGNNNILRRIANGKVGGVNIENLSLELIKKYYMAVPVSKANSEYYFNLNFQSTGSLLELLNIGFDKKYSKILGEQGRIDRISSNWQTQDRKDKQTTSLKAFYENNPEAKIQLRGHTTKLWQNEEHREKTISAMKKAAKRPEEIERRSKAMKAIAGTPERKAATSKLSKERWQNEEYRKAMSEQSRANWQNEDYRANYINILKQKWSNPEYRKRTIESIKASHTTEYRKKQSENSKKLWESKEHRNLMSIVHLAASKAWEEHPYAKKVYSEVAKEFPDLHIAIEKRKRKEPLTQREKSLTKLFFATCVEKYPNIPKEIGQIQKHILEEWGFYDGDNNMDELIEFINATASEPSI